LAAFYLIFERERKLLSGETYYIIILEPAAACTPQKKNIDDDEEEEKKEEREKKIRRRRRSSSRRSIILYVYNYRGTCTRYRSRMYKKPLKLYISGHYFNNTFRSGRDKCCRCDKIEEYKRAENTKNYIFFILFVPSSL